MPVPTSQRGSGQRTAQIGTLVIPTATNTAGAGSIRMLAGGLLLGAGRVRPQVRLREHRW